MKARIGGQTVDLDIEGRVGSGVDSDTQRDDRRTLRRERGVKGALPTVQFSASAPPSTNILLTSPKLVGAQSFFIPGQLPGLNEIIAAAKVHRGKWNKYDDMKRSYGEYIQTIIRLHQLSPMQRVSVEFEWVERDRKRDKDNIAVAKKFVLDALVTMKVIPNDGWKNVEGFSDTFTIDRAAPGVTVTLREVGNP